MNYLLSLNSPVRSIFWPKENIWIKQSLLILAGVIVLAFVSQLSIPLMPVPLTFQSTTVVLIGMAYGARYSVYVVAAYLIAGICGIPVFANFDAGSAKFFGPTLGYLLGFIPGAYLSGYLAQKGWASNVLGSFMTACLGTLVIFLCGVTTLAQMIGWHQAIAFGLMPFLISEPIKLLALSFITPRLWKKK